jgi:hypothetical protein
MFGVLPFTVGEDDDLDHPAQEQEEQRTMMISFEFPRGLKNSVIMCQVVVKAWGSSSGHYPKMDLSTDPVYSATLKTFF